MRLREISPSDAVTALVLAGFDTTCPIITRDVEFYGRSGNADSIKRAKQNADKEKIFRALNTNNEADKYTPNYDTVAKKIVSFDTQVDVSLEDRNEDPEAELAQETRTQAENVGYILQEKFFEAKVSDDPLSFNGLRELARLSGKVVMADNDDEDGIIILPVGNGDEIMAKKEIAIEALQAFFTRIRGGATHCYMNNQMKVRLLTIAKSLNYYRNSKYELGNEIEMIGDVIIRGAGYKENGDYLLPFTEEGDTTSIFACRWGERKDLTALTSVGVKARYAGQVGNFLINNVNLDMALHVQAPTALYQSKGWKLA